MVVVNLVFCFIGLTLAQQHTWNDLFSSTSQLLSNLRPSDLATCNHVDRKNHAIALIEEWIKHNHFEAVVKLYHDIYHHDLPQRRAVYQSTFDEAFDKSNTNPDYIHVEDYIKHNMNTACRTAIMKWIENMAMTHTTSPTHAPPTETPTTTIVETAVTKTICDQAEKNYVIGLLREWINHNHFPEVEQLYLDLALGIKVNNDPNSILPEYQQIKSYILNHMNDTCRHEIYAWIEEQAKTHTG